MNGINIDINLRDIGAPIISMLKRHNVKYMSLMRDNVVEGRSWEMAVSMSLLMNSGVYSGEVIAYTHSDRDWETWK